MRNIYLPWSMYRRIPESAMLLAILSLFFVSGSALWLSAVLFLYGAAIRIIRYLVGI